MKRIVLCSDGTWNQPGETNSHVVKVSRAIVPRAADGISQVVYYDQGVGTGNILDRVRGGVTGSGLEKNIQDLYRFLVHNYEEGDEIHLFGFSRGAYTVRSTAGLIRSAGVLKKSELHALPEAYKIYRSYEIGPDHPDAATFREQHAAVTNPRIQFIGVWDTVGSMGVPIRRWREAFSKIPGFRRWHRREFEFHDASLSSRVVHAFQALAIDEQRSAFEPSLWQNQPSAGQVIAQQWFSGVHSSVGGTSEDLELSRLTLQAMVDAASAAGLEFDNTQIPAVTARDFAGDFPRSPNGAYRLLPKHKRVIGATPTESVSASAIDRSKEPALNYDPANLRRFLDSQPPGP